MNGNTKAVYRAVYEAEKHTVSMKDLVLAIKGASVSDIKVALDDLVALNAVKVSTKEGEIDTVTTVFKGPSEAEVMHDTLMHNAKPVFRQEIKSTPTVKMYTAGDNEDIDKAIADIRKVVAQFMRD